MADLIKYHTTQGLNKNAIIMILSRIINDVRVSRDYNIEITFTTEIEQFGGVTQAGSFLENGVKIVPRMACAG